ncbi:MAG: energy-coupling factor transporter transmembrane protein EcfT [Anaerolineales bacterium]|nr:energy-coupling factor transporter transmembrane protein EcfT [Anaerolineales bacterium]
MSDRLSFHVQRDSFLHRLNPLTKLTLAFALVVVAFVLPFYWTPIFVLFAVIVPLSVSGKIFREFSWAALRLILPAVGFLFVMQALFQPIGEQVVFKFYFLDATTESVAYAFRNAARIFVMISAFTLFLLSTHPSELMSDLTRRGLPSQFSYVVISTLQIIPQMQAKANAIIAAQRSRGLDTESSFLKRAGALGPLVGPLVFGSLVEVEERAIAIEARGFTSKRAKTSLYEIADSKFESVLRWSLVALVVLSIGLNLWHS